MLINFSRIQGSRKLTPAEIISRGIFAELFMVLNDPQFVVWLLESLATMSSETSSKLPPETVTPVAPSNIGMVYIFPEFVLVTLTREKEVTLSHPMWVAVTEGFGVSSVTMGGTGGSSLSIAAGAGTELLAASRSFFSLSHSSCRNVFRMATLDWS